MSGGGLGGWPNAAASPPRGGVKCYAETMSGNASLRPNGELDLSALSGDQLVVALYLQINQLNQRMERIEAKIDRSATAEQLAALDSRVAELSGSLNAIDDRVTEIERQRKALDAGVLGRLKSRFGDFLATAIVIAMVVVVIGGIMSFAQNRERINELSSEVKRLEDLAP